jgi:hypothetical protein
MGTLTVLNHDDQRGGPTLRVPTLRRSRRRGDRTRSSGRGRRRPSARLRRSARGARGLPGDRRSAPSERHALLQRAVDVAEHAVAADDRDAVAHFALFCAVGKRLELAGPSVGSLAELRRLHAEVDRTLALEPDYVDAIVGKGALLLRAPRLLGGDPVAGERLLRRAIVLAPDSVVAQLELARGLAANGNRAGAESEAVAALVSAVRLADSAREADARALLARLAH